MNGFIIDKLIYTGNGVQDVSVDFKIGVNAIYGSSDTGKTYIYKSIDFMFAKDKPPTMIDEGKEYDTLYMVLNIGSDVLITLKRYLTKNSKLFVYRCSYEEVEDKKPEEYSCHVSSKKSMNKFYYSLLGVSESSYLEESKDKTKQFTIRYLIKYFMLSENKIIEESFSPVHVSGQHNMRHFDKNAFNSLVSNYNETEKRTQKQVDNIRKIEIQLDLIDSMIGEYRVKLSEKENELALLQMDDVGSVIDNLKYKITNVQSRIKELSNEKIDIEKNVNTNDNRVSNLSDTLMRFEILEQQYQNEMERYDFIYQGSHLIEQLPKRKCPVCDNDFNMEMIDTDLMYEAMQVESNIIRKKQKDLKDSITDINVEVNSINMQNDVNIKKLELIDSEITFLSKNELTSLDLELKEYIYHEQLMSEVNRLQEDIESFKTRRTTLQSKTVNNEVNEQIPTENYDEMIQKGIELLCSKIEMKLKRWLSYEEVKVEFSDDFDLVINGKSRKSFGKGYRSLIHTAYYLALYDIMKTVGSPSFNFIIIDSPLTAYTGSDTIENGDIVVSEQTIKDFYNNLVEDYKDSQIIIIDNKKIPENIDVHEIHFTRNNSFGRYGLFPV